MQHIMALAHFINMEGKRHIEVDDHLAELEKENNQLMQQAQRTSSQMHALEQLNFILAQTVSAREAEVEKLQTNLKAERKKLKGVQADFAVEKKTTKAVDSLRSQVERLRASVTAITSRLD